MMLPANKRFTDFVIANQLFTESDVILLGVSGGKDSVLMTELFANAGYKFAIAHCNFNLRGDEALRDENFVRDLAKRLNVAFYQKSFDTKLLASEQKISIQMAARQLRYAFFKELLISEKLDKLAIAQHQNDAIETVLINLIRGTGIAGLHGIKKSKDNIIRPMLCFTANEVESIVAENGINYVEDSSNASNKYMRNKLRLDVIPKMEELNPALAQTFKQNIGYFSQLEELLNERVTTLKSEIFKQQDNGVIKIKIVDLLSLNPQQLLLFELLKPYGFNATQVDNLILCLTGHSGKQFFTDDFVLTVDRENIEISPLLRERLRSEITIPDLGNYSFENAELSISEVEELPKNLSNKSKIFVDAGKLVFPLQLRNWQSGDVFNPFGMRGFKKLSDYFIQEKIPRHQKDTIPILVNGNHEIIWVCGLRSDDRYKVNANSKKIITFELHNL